MEQEGLEYAIVALISWWKLTGLKTLMPMTHTGDDTDPREELTTPILLDQYSF